MDRTKLTGLLCCSVSALALVATPSSAADSDTTVDAVIVTATKRAENIQDVPLSVSAVSGKDLERRGIQDVAELSQFVPSLRIARSNSARNSAIYIRGIGATGNNQGVEPSIGIFLDGVYLPIPLPIFSNLRDISTVEVLRGPQGTLYGRNTPVGAININTRQPTQETEGSVTVSYGNYNDVQVSGYANGRLTDTLAGRLSFWSTNRDGYEKNLAVGRDDINSMDQYGFRGRVQWTPNENTTGNFAAYYTRITSHCCAPEQLDIPKLATPGFLAASTALGYPFLNFTPGDHKVEEYNAGLAKSDIYGASATFDHTIENVGTITSITGFSGIFDDFIDPAAFGLSRPTAPDNAQKLQRDTFSQEIRFASPDTGRVSYLGGVYLYTDKAAIQSRIILGVGADRLVNGARLFKVDDRTDASFNQRTNSAAAFGQVKFSPTDQIHLIAGLRYSHDKKKADTHQSTTPTSSPTFRASFPTTDKFGLKHSEDRVTYSLTAQYDISDDVMVYATTATGSKSGGFNGSPVGPTIPLEFSAEKSQTTEVGVKSVLFDRRLILNFDVYHMTVKNFQEQSVNPAGTGFIFGNAGNRRANGFELEASLTPAEGLSLQATVGYLDAKFTNYPGGPCYTGQTPNGVRAGTCDYKGLTPQQSPKWSTSFAGSYRRPLGSGGLVGFMQGDVSTTSKVFNVATLDPRGLQSSITLVGARVGFEGADGRWTVAAYGKNLTDETYYISTTNLILGSFLSATGNATAVGYVGWYAPPRTYGVEATFKF